MDSRQVAAVVVKSAIEASVEKDSQAIRHAATVIVDEIVGGNDASNDAPQLVAAPAEEVAAPAPVDTTPAVAVQKKNQPLNIPFDYYRMLKVSRGATNTEIRDAYHTLSRKHHPQMNPLNTETAEFNFYKVSEAYYVLSNPDLRAKFDSLGAKAFRQSGFMYNKNPLDQFEHAFVVHSNYAFDEDEDFPTVGKREKRRPKAEDQVVDLVITLEDLKNGTNKAVNVVRTRNGTEHKKTFFVQVKSWYKSGTKITYKGQGSQTFLDETPGDLAFVIRCAEHEQFTRSGDNLQTTCVAKRTDKHVYVAMPDGTRVAVEAPEVSGVQQKVVKRGQGFKTASGDVGDLEVFVTKTPSIF